jgi:Vacuolar protein sorting-associated protein 26
MELAIVRREAAGTGTNIYNESETIVKYEVMDGAPVKGKKRTGNKTSISCTCFHISLCLLLVHTGSI